MGTQGQSVPREPPPPPPHHPKRTIGHKATVAHRNVRPQAPVRTRGPTKRGADALRAGPSAASAFGLRPMILCTRQRRGIPGTVALPGPPPLDRASPVSESCPVPEVPLGPGVTGRRS